MSYDAQYTRLPTSDASLHSRSTSPSGFKRRRSASNEKREEQQRVLDEQHAALAADPRFNRPPPSRWQRAGLLFFIAALFWLAFQLRVKQPEPPKIVHANRYVSSASLHGPLYNFNLSYRPTEGSSSSPILKLKNISYFWQTIL
jgi:hypothetical protein